MLLRPVIFNVFIVLTSVLGSRKYDIEQESMKLFGEDLASVLQGFRRSPEYLTILENEMADFYQYFGEMQMAILRKNMNEMIAKIKNMFNQTNGDDKKSLRMGKKLARRSNVYGRNIPKTSKVRQVEEEGEEVKDIGGVRRLELRAAALMPGLSYDDQVTYRNIGFEYAGRTIHDIVKSISDGEVEDRPRWTMLPDGGAEGGGGNTEPPVTAHQEHTVLPQSGDHPGEHPGDHPGEHPGDHPSTKHEGPMRQKKDKKHKG